MKKGDAAVLAQLLNAMKDAVVRLEESHGKKDGIEMNKSKKEILRLQKEIDNVL